MTVADLYIALVLIGVCVGIGWALHSAVAENDERLAALEDRPAFPYFSSLPPATQEAINEILRGHKYAGIPR